MGDNSENKKIVGFKKFTDIKGKSKVEEISPSMDMTPNADVLPMNPNIPINSKKVEKTTKKNTQPVEKQTDIPSEEVDEKKVETFGKVAKFPKGVKASKAFNFLEAVKVSKKSIWYIIVERQENELQMIKYNYKEGVDLNKFVSELKSYYLKENISNPKICEAISKIKVDGNDKYSIVQNIPLIEVNGTKLITKLTQDLIKLLSR